MQYTILEIQLWSVKCTTVIVGYSKILSILSQVMQTITMDRSDDYKPISKCTAHNYLNSIWIILLVKNKFTNICSKISKTGKNLWMVYTCNIDMKKCGKCKTKRCEEGDCTLHLDVWPKSSEICVCSIPF